MFVSQNDDLNQDIASEFRLCHVPVLMDEVLSALDLREGNVVVDATFGGGGYTRAILDAQKDVKVVAFDRDREAIERSEPLKKKYNKRLQIIESKFSKLDQFLPEKVDAVVFDLGVSSFHLDDGARGFSFRFDAPLDMRMGVFEDATPTAADLVNGLDETTLANVLYQYGEERMSRKIAREIVTQRAIEPILTTFALKKVIHGVVRAKPHEIDPATRSFQALRIAVNDELRELVEGMLAAERVLGVGGRMVVVSFHSLEDRIVKRFFDMRSGKMDTHSRFMPVQAEKDYTFEVDSRRAVSAKSAEVQQNPRSRSAKLRVGMRTDVAPIALKQKDYEKLGLPFVRGVL